MVDGQKNPTFKNSRLPLPFEIINLWGSFLEKTGLGVKKHDVNRLIASASKKAGLKDFGGENFIPALEKLVNAANNCRHMKLYERLSFDYRINVHLVNRLRIQKRIKENPEICYEKIEKPIFIVSLQRTGTTLLHNLLARDKDNKVIFDYEAFCPSPLVNKNRGENDPRIKMVERKYKMLYFLAPHLPTIHFGSAFEPEECVHLLLNCFLCHMVAGFDQLVEYQQWLSAQNIIPFYEYYKLQLQLIQFFGRKGTWVLKSVNHLNYLDAIINVFPDSTIIQIHRNPLKAIPSGCSLRATHLQMLKGRIDLAETGNKYLDIQVNMLNKAMDFREKQNLKNFYDISYTDLVRDPIMVVEKIYKNQGYKFTDLFKQKMVDWLNKNPENKYGKHVYSLDQFGLTEDLIKTKLQRYIEKYKVMLE